MADQQSYDGIEYRAETKSPLVFRLLISGLGTWAVLFMGYYLFSGWSSEAEFAQQKKAKAERLAQAPKALAGAPAAGGHREGEQAEYLAIGKKQYAERCAACHGPAGKGGIGPNLTLAEYKYGRGKDQVAESIRTGRPGGMPGFGNQLSHEQLEGLVSYVLSLK